MPSSRPSRPYPIRQNGCQQSICSREYRAGLALTQACQSLSPLLSSTIKASILDLPRRSRRTLPSHSLYLSLEQNIMIQTHIPRTLPTPCPVTRSSLHYTPNRVVYVVGFGRYHLDWLVSCGGSISCEAYLLGKWLSGLYRLETGTFIGDQDGVCLTGVSFCYWLVRVLSRWLGISCALLLI
ncbi:hypothetical protein BDW42DRAFT_27721 [Aspergillus taichungensis]|uniref:Uncharacterized protein n=1 Tax=Aspergillus taichungensis TaxID=482145 RepID=A0A2J5HGB6_9EURO|nr:hypothetical protein BDW42DRAFT_27721 [Aspergillus taichungensis]